MRRDSGGGHARGQRQRAFWWKATCGINLEPLQQKHRGEEMMSIDLVLHLDWSSVSKSRVVYSTKASPS